jgi:hypothetical protein
MEITYEVWSGNEGCGNWELLKIFLNKEEATAFFLETEKPGVFVVLDKVTRERVHTIRG